MAKTVFVPETTVTSAFLNAINNPVRDDQDLDGHIGYVKNSDMDPSPGSLYPEWLQFRDNLKVTGVTGLTASYNSGNYTNLDGESAAIIAGTVALADNATNYVYINLSGNVVAATLLPVNSIPLAKITTVGGAISGAITDLRPRFKMQPLGRGLFSFGGSGGSGDMNITANTSLGGEIYCRNFTIAAGVTVTVPGGYLKIKASGSLTIDGVVNVSPPIQGGRGWSGDTQLNPVFFLAEPGLGFGGGGGHNAAQSNGYSYLASAYGSGGASGLVMSENVNSIVTSGRGGNGGGAFMTEVAGPIRVTGTINVNGNNGTNGTIGQIGAGGKRIWVSGGAGGSGGLIWLLSRVSVTCTATSTLSVIGGNGGSAATAGTTDKLEGAGGGGGGYVVAQSPNNNLTGAVINLTAGTTGTATGTTGTVSGSAGGSFAGRGGLTNFTAENGQLVLLNAIPL